VLEAALLCGVVLAAFTVEAALGFGATVVTVALASMFLPLGEVLPAYVPVNMALSAALVVKGRAHVDARLLFTRVAPAVALGMPIGMWLFGRADERLMKLAFGAFIILLGSAELARSSKESARASEGPPRVVEWVLLLLGGVAHGAYGTGGPMVVYVAGRRLAASKATFRATLSLLWLVLNTVLVGSFVLRGEVGRTSLTRSAMLFPSLLAGLWLGQRLHDRAHAGTFRTAVFGGLVVAGLVLVVRNLLLHAR
jgi:hypothetical protein